MHAEWCGHIDHMGGGYEFDDKTSFMRMSGMRMTGMSASGMQVAKKVIEATMAISSHPVISSCPMAGMPGSTVAMTSSRCTM